MPGRRSNQPVEVEAEMEYSIEHGEAGITLEVSGDIDMATAERLAEALEVCLEWDGQITIDLSGVGFMDSSGLRVIIQASQSLNGDDPLSLRSPQPPVARLFEIAGLLDLPSIEMVGVPEVGLEPHAARPS
ncbi:MAG: STAS domain-containing protein, partial [Actinomycetota bacterium]|nr:STAS domain-containing protein [Actinomycetota bacterium]